MECTVCFLGRLGESTVAAGALSLDGQRRGSAGGAHYNPWPAAGKATGWPPAASRKPLDKRIQQTVVIVRLRIVVFASGDHKKLPEKTIIGFDRVVQALA